MPMVPPDVNSSQGRQRRARPSGAATSDRTALRKQLRAARKRISLESHQHAAQQAARHFFSHRLFRSARSIAVYHPVGSEFDARRIADFAHRCGKPVYFPLMGRRRMDFVRAHPASRWRVSFVGIPEPVALCARDRVRAPRLDCVLLPLLGFDATGTRLGSGAGYYDRAFAFRRLRKHWRKPKLIGLAFDVQGVKKLPRAAWDVPLDGVLTETGLRLFR